MEISTRDPYQMPQRGNGEVKTGLCISVRRKSWEESVISTPFAPIAVSSIIPQIPNVSYAPEPTAGSVKTGRHSWH